MTFASFDTSALTERVDYDEANGYERAAKERFGERPRPQMREWASAVFDNLGIAVWAVLGVALVLWPLTWGDGATALDTPVKRLFFGLALLAPFSIVFFWIFGGIAAAISRGDTLDAFPRFRLARFAEANGMRYQPRRRLEQGAEVHDLMLGAEPRAFEIGNLHLPWEPGPVVDGKPKAIFFHLGCIAVRLRSPMPHIVLDARGNDLHFEIGAGIDDDQRLSLAGEFDARFTLYCPRATSATPSTSSRPM